MKKFFLLAALALSAASAWAIDIVEGKTYTIKAYFTSYADLYFTNTDGALSFSTSMVETKSYWIAEASGDDSFPWKFKSAADETKYLTGEAAGISETAMNFKVKDCTYPNCSHLWANISGGTGDRNVGTWSPTGAGKSGFGKYGAGGCWGTGEANGTWTTDYVIEQVAASLDDAKVIAIAGLTYGGVGYPSKDSYDTAVAAINAATNNAEIAAAVDAFNASGVVMPENGKKYVFKSVFPGADRESFILGEKQGQLVATANPVEGPVAAGKYPATAVFTATKLADGQYEFVSCTGKYLMYNGLAENNATAAISTTNLQSAGSVIPGSFVLSYANRSASNKNAGTTILSNTGAYSGWGSGNTGTRTDYSNMFRVVEAEDAYMPDLNKMYYIKNNNADKYLVINSGNATISSTNKTMVHFETAGLGFAIKTKEGKYLGASSWNTTAQTDAFAWVVEEVAGGYAFNQQTSTHKGYIGLDSTEEGKSTFCNKGASNNYAFTLEEATFPVSVSAAGYATLYFDAALTVPTGVKAYTLALAENGEWLTATEISEIPANTGVVLVNEGDYDFPAFVAVSENATSCLEGTLVAKATPTGCCTLAVEDGVPGFYSYTGETVAANKAYYIASSEAASNLRIVFDNDTLTSIITAAQENGGQAIYDLQGRRVVKTQNGLNIVNGKKVIK